jgi:ABC-type branched-subunit amino acid transport system ATPase component
MGTWQGGQGGLTLTGMDDRTYAIRVPYAHVHALPPLDTTVRRITVILGANGTGKSRLLEMLRGVIPQFVGCDHEKVVRIAGGRVVKPPQQLTLAAESRDHAGTPSVVRLRQAYVQSRQGETDARLRSALQLLHQIGAEGKADHSDAVTAWQRDGGQGPCPVREPPPIERLAERFSALLPDLRIFVQPDGQFVCQRGAEPYPLTRMSDGERQVFYLLTEVGLTPEPASVFLVDEPELNLNASLAARLWDALEEMRPEAIFLYATHSVAFAMRGSVQKVIVLGRADSPAVEVTDLSGLSAAELREFLGSVPAILKSTSALAVEGKVGSIDCRFYQWVLGRSDIVVVPLEDCHAVAAAVTRTGIWEKVAPEVQIAGVIDRDVRSDDDLRAFPERCAVLDFHEAESYLCHPDVVVALARRVGTGPPPEPGAVVGLLLGYISENAHRLAAQRVGWRLRITLTVTPEGEVLGKLRSAEQVREAIGRRAREQSQLMQRTIGEEVAQRVYAEELGHLEAAVCRADVEELLQLCPAKQVLPRVAALVDLKGPDAYVNAVLYGLNPDDFPFLVALRRRLLGALNLAEPGEA